MAQFEIPLALIFYLRNRNSGAALKTFSQAAGLSLLTLWTQSYLFVMVIGIVFATVAQAVTNRALDWRAAVAGLLSVAAFSGGVVALSGHLASSGALASEGFGFFSMNMLSPFAPPRSGLAHSLVVLDCTGGQYEGFNYLGGGVLLLLIAAIARPLKTRLTLMPLLAIIKRNQWLFTMFVGFTLFALSNVVYLGPWKILDLPLSQSLLDLASMFRSSGRFFWPVMYAVTALAIAAAIPLHGQRGVISPALLAAAALPVDRDTAPLRAAVSHVTAAPESSHIDLAAWRAAIARHQFVRVLPPYSCLAKPPSWNQEVAVEIELAAAFADTPVNSVYAARFKADCHEEGPDGASPMHGGALTVYLNEYAGIDRVRALAAAGNGCRGDNRLVVCSASPGEAPQPSARARGHG